MAVHVHTSVAESIDQPVIEAFEEDPNRPVRLRLQPFISRRPESRRIYLAWPNLIWRVDVETLEDAQELREALTLFFQLIGRDGGPQQVRALLTNAAAAA